MVLARVDPRPPAEGRPGPCPARLGLTREARAPQDDGGVPAARHEKGLALTPRVAPAANNLAWILSEHGGDRDRALALAQTAKEQAPEDPHLSDTLERNVPEVTLPVVRG